MTQKVRFRNMERFGFGPNVMKKTKICPNCGRMVGVRTRNCPECGEKLSNETIFDRYKRQHSCCFDCDTVLAPDSQYCPNCGKKIESKRRVI